MAPFRAVHAELVVRSRATALRYRPKAKPVMAIEPRVHTLLKTRGCAQAVEQRQVVVGRGHGIGGVGQLFVGDRGLVVAALHRVDHGVVEAVRHLGAVFVVPFDHAQVVHGVAAGHD